MPSAHRSRASLQKKRCGLKAFPLRAPRHTSRRLRLATRVIMRSIARGVVQPNMLKQHGQMMLIS